MESKEMPMVTRQTRNAPAASGHGKNQEIIPVPTMIEEVKEAVDHFPRMGVIAAIVRIL